MVDALTPFERESAHATETYNEKTQCILKATDGKNTLGFISCTLCNEIYGVEGRQRVSHWYATIAVKPEYRGRGIAETLINGFLRKVKKEKRGKFLIWHCMECNEASAALARKFGGVQFKSPWEGWKSFLISLTQQPPQDFIQKYLA